MDSFTEGDSNIRVVSGSKMVLRFFRGTKGSLECKNIRYF